MKNPATDVVDDLMFLAPHTEVVHHIPGRIRLRILPSGLGAVGKTDVKGMIGSIPGIVSIRINYIIGSVVIEYDQNRLPFSIWESLKDLRKRPELAAEFKKRLQGLWDGC